MKSDITGINSYFLPGGVRLCRAVRAALLLGLVCAAIFSASSVRGETITVLRLQNCSNDESLNWVGIGLADMMLCLLRGTNAFDLAEREQLGDMLEEQGFAASGFVDPAAATKAGRIVKADLALGGGYSVSNDMLNISAFIVNTRNGQVMAAASWQDIQARLLKAPGLILTQLLRSFGRSISEADMTRLAQTLPGKLDAARAYYQGLDQEIAGNPAGALKYYLSGDGYPDAHPMLPLRLGRLYFLLDEIEMAGYYAFHGALSASIEQCGHRMLLLFDTAMRCGKENKREMKIALLKRCIELGEKHEAATGEARELKKRLPFAFKAAIERFKMEKADKRVVTAGAERIRVFTIHNFFNDRDLGKASWFVWQGITDASIAIKPYKNQINAQLELALEYEEQGNVNDALDIYSSMLEDLKCIDDLYYELGGIHESFTFLLPSEIRGRGSRAIVRNAWKTGTVIRHPKFVNLVNENNPVFMREAIPFICQGVTALRETGWHIYGYAEYYTFAAPSGQRIAGVTVQPIQVCGRLNFEISNENPFYGSLAGIGSHVGAVFGDEEERQKNKSVFGQGESVDMNFNDARTMLRVQVFANAKEYSTWRLKFRLAPVGFDEQKVFLAGLGQKYQDLPKRVEFQNAILNGLAAYWDDIREVYDVCGVSSIRGYHVCAPKSITRGDKGFLFHAASVGGNLKIVRLDPPEEAEYRLPNLINTDGHEEQARLYFWRNGIYQLVWARYGFYDKPEQDARFDCNVFTAFSSNLRKWTIPKRMTFAGKVPKDWPTHVAVRLARNIVQVRAGKYFGIGPNGEIAESDDAINWTFPGKNIRTADKAILFDTDQDSSGRIWALMSDDAGRVLLLRSDDAQAWAAPVQAPISVKTTGFFHGATIACLPAGRVAIIKSDGCDEILTTPDDGKSWETFPTGLPIMKRIDTGTISIAVRNDVMFLLLGSYDKAYYIGQSREMFTLICGIAQSNALETGKDSGLLFKTWNAQSVPTGLLSLPYSCEGLPEGIKPIEEVFSWHISSKLASKAGLPLVDRVHVAQMMKELGFGLSGGGAESPDSRVVNAGRMLGARYMLSGSIHKAERGVQVMARVFDVETARIVASATKMGPLESLESIAALLSDELAAQLDIKPFVNHSQPLDFQPLANLCYMRGLVDYYNGRYPESVECFVQTLIEDSEFVEVRFWLANAFMKMQKYGEAYMQFRKVKMFNPKGDYAATAAEKMIACRAHLSADEVGLLVASERGD